MGLAGGSQAPKKESIMTIDKLLGIDYPIIVAPMFLISNTKMVKAAITNGVTAAFPALNYRTEEELRSAIKDIKAVSDKPFGVNLIVNKSNPKYSRQLEILLELRVPFIITSLGNPREVIQRAHAVGIKVFCDVTDLNYARKVEALGADALVAVNSRAGGHAGSIPPKELVTLLKENCSIPIISAGGVGTSGQVKEALDWGAAGVQVGTVFIASEESEISPEYKQALIDYGENDIVRTTKLSGSPLTVINTPAVKEMGTKANWLEWILNNNRTLKNWAKMLLAYKGMNLIRKSALGATYKNIWCAGPAIEYVHKVRPMKEIIEDLTSGLTRNEKPETRNLA